MRRAKIVATLGPATSSLEQIVKLIDAGLDVVRLNMSHGDRATHEMVYANVREAESVAGRPVAVLADLQGPKIRLGTFSDGPHSLAEGDSFTITADDIPGTRDICSTTFKKLPENVKPGDPILIDDGKVRLIVTSVEGSAVHTRVDIPGEVSNNKGINLPGVPVDVPAMSEKDEDDLRWALRIGADFAALSFVRNAADVSKAREIMDEIGRTVPVIAKIEKPQAVDDLENIIDAFDGIMVARGDLGVELPLEAVPIVQKRAVELARRQAKPVIVATQMLESMISSPRPTRAEASDCANAVLDGADALMLSGETSVGEYPVETVATMAKIIESTEEHGLDRIAPVGTKPKTQGGALTLAAAEIADFLEADIVCVFTESGDSVRRMSRIRHSAKIYAFTPTVATRRKLCLTWGVQSFQVDPVKHTDEMFPQVDDILLGGKLAQEGDKVIVIAGTPPGIAGSTNDLRIHRIGDAHAEVAPAYQNL